MSTAHTPGPWTTRPIYGTLPDQAHALFWQDGQRSRRLDDGGVFKAEDAALIAAAPDLLAAMQAIRARIDGDWDNPALLAMGPLNTDIGMDCARFADAAIAKAEGRS